MRFFIATLLSLITLVAVAQSIQQPAVTIRWGAVTTMNDGTPLPSGVVVSYNLYGSHAATGPWSTPVAILGNSTIRYGVALGTDCYYLAAVVNGKEGLPTAPFCLNVTATPSSIPSTPTNVTIVQNQP